MVRCGPDDVNCRRLARLCLRHNSGDYYEVADRLTTQLKLRPPHKRRVMKLISNYVQARKPPQEGA